MTQFTLPAEIIETISAARLPASYEQAKQAIAACERIDECREWADKAAALASYARQSDDQELENIARRIRARAARRCGELLQYFDGRGGDRSKSERGLTFAPPSRREATQGAGLSEHKARTAVRLALIDTADFEAAIEKPIVPGTTLLAQMRSKDRQAERCDKISTVEEDFRAMGQTNRSGQVIEALLKLERQIDACALDQIVTLLSDQDDERLRRVNRACAFVKRLESTLAKSGILAKPSLKSVE